jgi:hypothetical protein
MNCVYCSIGMTHFGKVASKALGWPLYVNTMVGTCDTVYIIGLYDPPSYLYTLMHTAKAKKRVIHMCGTDVQALVPESLPAEATYICESQGLADEMWEKASVKATVIPFPTAQHYEMNPFPSEPAVAFYTGMNPAQYGSGIMEAIDAAYPELAIFPYYYGQYDAGQMQALCDKTTICMRLPLHDGSAASAREFMEAGRRVISTTDLPFATRVNRFGVPGIFKALNKAMREKEPDTAAAGFYRKFNSEETYLEAVRGLL